VKVPFSKPTSCGRSCTVIPSTPGLPLFRLDSCQCLLAVLPLADFLHQPFANGRAFSSALRRERFGPFLRGRRSFPPTLLREDQHWFFCRLSLICRATYSHSHLSLAGTVRAFVASATTWSSADFCRPVRADHSSLSLDSETNGRGKFIRLQCATPDLQPVPLMDTDFAVICPLVRHPYASDPVLVHRLAPLLRASFRLHLTVRPLRFAITSRPSRCEEDLHLQLINMLGTRKKSRVVYAALSPQVRDERGLQK
jgi:hypothetical protein